MFLFRVASSFPYSLTFLYALGFIFSCHEALGSAIEGGSICNAGKDAYTNGLRCKSTSNWSGPEDQPLRDHAFGPLWAGIGSTIPRPRIGDVPYDFPMITSCKGPGMLAITYDDGPYEYTGALLDILHDLEVQATFFVTGNNLEKGQIDDPSTLWPQILRWAYNAGHQIGSHTWTHRDLNQADATDRRSELVQNEVALHKIFGWIPMYFRPPYLECSVESGCGKFVADYAYHSISTNLDTKDYMFDHPQLIQQSKDRFSDGLSKDSSQNSYISLAHDTHQQTVINLTLHMVTTAKERGYRLVTVGECLGDPRQNWYRLLED